MKAVTWYYVELKLEKRKGDLPISSMMTVGILLNYYCCYWYTYQIQLEVVKNKRKVDILRDLEIDAISLFRVFFDLQMS